jgi:hypothetical protein
MAGPAHTLDRLLTALEDLVAGERSALRDGDYADALALQERAAPVVARLVELAPAASESDRVRVRRLVTSRDEQSRWLGEAMALARDELARMAEGRRVVARIAPVYGRMAATGVGASHFSSQA